LKIPDETKIQSIDLRVKDIESSMKFYSELIGLKEISRNSDTVQLSANGEEPYLICLNEDKSAVPKHKSSTGLFHTAIRLPNRKELARVFMRLFDNKLKFQGFSDHLVSEAIYLADPDENGVELYADKPQSRWQYRMGQVEMDTLPLDLSSLAKEFDDRIVWNGIHPDTDIGHIHLCVSDLHKAQEVYSMILGMNITNSSYPGALFYSAGGYHHHIGTNVWSSRNSKPSTANSAGLMKFTVKIPDKNYLGEIKKRISESVLAVLPAGNDSFSFLDFDKIKITLSL
jgi:catechol 2,3-dioxygenase